MCGIFGYIGKGPAANNIREGLKRLEYRGYDSWGIAVLEDGNIQVQKQVGTISKVDSEKLSSKAVIGVGHTRWATHGGVTEINAHPHISTDGRFTLAQNGIVENYQELTKDLINKGYEFRSQTDTEVIVRLVEEKLRTEKDLVTATRLAFNLLEGRNTIILLDRNEDRIIAIRNGSPLVIGIHGNEYYLASDTLSFADKTNNIVQMKNLEMVVAHPTGIKKFDAVTGKEVEVIIEEVDIEDSKIDKEGFQHFMLKEIVEQQDSIINAVQYSDEELQPLLDAIRQAETVYTIGAGTASFSAGQIAWALRNIAEIKAIDLKSYEISGYRNLFSEKDIVIVVSQSGETADTIEAVEIAKEYGVKIVSIVNMLGSTISRISDLAYYSRSGPEICVASTKAFTAQVAWGTLVASALVGRSGEYKKEIRQLSSNLKDQFTEDTFDQYRDLAKKLKKKEHFFVLGRDSNYYIALEGALKIKEITYKHFEGFAAGELKHGVIALIDKDTPVFIITPTEEQKADLLSAAAEVKARGANVIGIGAESNELFDVHLKTNNLGSTDPISNVIPFQLIAYFLGVELGTDPDRPRNLAKSVTVK